MSLPIHTWHSGETPVRSVCRLVVLRLAVALDVVEVDLAPVGGGLAQEYAVSSAARAFRHFRMQNNNMHFVV